MRSGSALDDRQAEHRGDARVVVRAELGNDHYSQHGQEQTRSRLRHIERREWWLWATAVMITLLLTAGILSFLPMLLQSNERSDYFFTLRRAMCTRFISNFRSTACVGAYSREKNCFASLARMRPT